MHAHLGTDRPLDDRLVRLHRLVHLRQRHRALDQLVQQFLWQFRQRPLSRCPGH